MRSKVLATLLALGLLGAAVSAASAAVTPMTAMQGTGSPADSAATPAVVSTPAPTPAPVAATPAPAAAPAPKSGPNEKIYYGGTVTISFGSTSRIGFFPMLGYKFTPRLSGGVEAGYEYVSYSNDQSSSNYGGSVFGRFRVGRNLYAHGEYQNMNYEIFTTRTSSSRQWVPALLVGGGIVKPLSGRSSVYAEVLFDVLQDSNSPYSDWEPVVNVGVSVGF